MAVKLEKGQRISLEKEAGGSLSKVVMGLGWDIAKGKDIDLDASCVMFNAGKKMVDSVWFRQLKSKDGSIVHTGDNLTGEGEGDDEQIKVDLNAVPANVESLIFVVNSFTGQSFNEIQNAFCRVYDANTSREIARYDLSCKGNHTALILSKLYRHNSEWKMHAIGENAKGKTVKDLVPSMKAHL